VLGRPVRIGRQRLRQLLHERGISFQRTRTWKESTDPDRDAKLDRIEYVTSAPVRYAPLSRAARTTANAPASAANASNAGAARSPEAA
jgi:hypothetical protein